MSPDWFGDVMVVVGIICAVVFVVLFALSLVWVYRDAEARGKTGCLWLLIVFFTWPFGLLAYVLLRNRTVQL
jgi:hypothetical protein